MLYFHGFPGSRLEAEFADSIASDTGTRLIAVDRPGMGMSDYLPSRTILGWADDVLALADHLGIGQFSVVGVSGGAPYALVCAFKLPDRIPSAAIVSGVGPPAAVDTASAVTTSGLGLRLTTHKPWVASLLSRIVCVFARHASSLLITMLWAIAPEPDRRILPRCRLSSDPGDKPARGIQVWDPWRGDRPAAALRTVELRAPRRAHAGTPVVWRGRPRRTGFYLLSWPDIYVRTFAALPPDRVSDAYRIGLWVWETPIFPDGWRYALDAVHEIWTPSEYSGHTIAQGSGDVPVVVRPHHVTPSRDISPLDRGRYGLPDDAFVGLAIMGTSHCPARKNPWAHIAAWQAAFGNDPAYRLLMKIRTGKRTHCVRRELEEMARATGNVHLFEADLSSPEIAGLQSGADVYLSLHRAEGYGLNIRECLEYGTPSSRPISPRTRNMARATRTTIRFPTA